jgi:hypothetical protein
MEEMKARFWKLLFAAQLLALGIPAAGGEMSDCPMMKKGAGVSHDHARGVETRGDQGMGFSHEKTTHHFRLSPEGGAIEVVAKDTSDSESQNQIRMHLSHIAKAFANGNFAIPMFVHDTVPPGVSAMKRRRGAIEYRYEEVAGGARVRLSTRDADALDAIHDFLRFQIADHETGDPGTVEGDR